MGTPLPADSQASTTPDSGKIAPPPNVLSGTTWVWRETDYGESSVAAPNDDFVLSFTETEIKSATDCNSLSGTYVSTDIALTLSPLAMTEMYCEGSLDTAYANDLAKALGYVISGSALTIQTEGGTELRFQRTEGEAQEPTTPSTEDPDTPVSSSDEVISVDSTQE